MSVSLVSNRYEARQTACEQGQGRPRERSPIAWTGATGAAAVARIKSVRIHYRRWDASHHGLVLENGSTDWRSSEDALPCAPHMLRHSTGYKLANDGHDTRSLAHYLGHRNLQSTARYTALVPGGSLSSGRISAPIIPYSSPVLPPLSVIG
jgi:hypothetical protein